MRAIAFTAFGGSEKLNLIDLPLPIPSDSEVQFKVSYAGVNPVDWKIREGLLKDRIPHEFPIISGWEASGVVTAVGKNVNKFKVGDHVYGYCRKPLVKWGTYAEYVTCDESALALKPNSLNFAQAAVIPLVGLTAWQALYIQAKLQKGESILIHAGAGGVGSLAIQFAKATGAKVYTTASKANHPYVKDLGADVLIDYTSENFVGVIKKLAPSGLDVVFDTVGGKTFKESLEVLKPGGRLVSLLEQLDPVEAGRRKIQAAYVFVAANSQQLTQIGELITQGVVKPPHLEEMALEEAAKAQDRLKEGHTKGKIVLRVS
jgi:NADPH:quinone reductase-like Zn-dependent oxidoreductase